MSREDRVMEVGVLQVDCCKPIERTDALKDASLHQHPEWELVKGPVQNVQVPRSVITHHLSWVR